MAALATIATSGSGPGRRRDGTKGTRRMPKKGSARRDADSTRPKGLRKRLRKAEDQLQDAQAKRDRAQARVEALSIIADEIRAQLAEADQADEATRAAAATAKAARVSRATRAPGSDTTEVSVDQPGRPATSKPTKAVKAPAVAATKPTTRKVTARRSAAAAPESDTVTARKPTRSRSRSSGSSNASDTSGE